MQVKTEAIFNRKDFNKIYSKTNLPEIYYLKIKSPLAVQYEVTTGCNQKCIFCYNVWKEGCIKQKTETLTKKLQFKVLDKILKLEIFDIIFSGGEPLTISWLENMIKKVSEKKIEASIITNGILMTQERAEALRNAGLKSMQISLHHYSAKINDALTGKKGSFQKTVNGIKNAITVFGSEAVNINMVALNHTYKDVYKMAKFLSTIGKPSFSVGTPTATGEMHNNKKLIINKKKFLSIYNQLIQAKKDFNINVAFTGGFPMCILPEIKEETISMIGNYCDAGLNQLVIDPAGNLKPCVCLDYKLGNILKDDAEKIWKNNNFLINIRKLNFAPKHCIKCKYISICRGGCRASAKGFYGKIDAPDPLEA